MASIASRHTPVMAARIVELLAPALSTPGSVLVDCTLGMGGHTEAVLAAAPHAVGIGLDRDPEALAMAQERLSHLGPRFRAVHAVYDELPAVLRTLGVSEVHAILFDLGVSSWQLDSEPRGFAYRVDTPLDMRMDPTRGASAADLLATADRHELERILRVYGEERFAGRIAREIVRRREVAPLTTSQQLVALVHDAVPAAAQHSGHPAKRTFQALRVAVNDEVATWERALPAALSVLAVGGRIAVLSYHSLEDRVTKTLLTTGARSSAPLGLPVELPEHAPELELLTKGAERPDASETEANPRAIPARLRAAQRVRPHSGARS